MKRTIKGFTMIELLMVMGVISVLASVLMILVNPAEMSRRSRDSKRMSDIGTLRRAIDLALADDQTATATGGAVDIGASTNVTNFAGTGLDISKYLPVVPQDPAYGTSGNSQIIASGCTKGSMAKSSMSYKFWTDGDTYILRSYMESLTSCDDVQNDGNSNTTYETGTEPGLDAI